MKNAISLNLSRLCRRPWNALANIALLGRVATPLAKSKAMDRLANDIASSPSMDFERQWHQRIAYIDPMADDLTNSFLRTIDQPE